VRCPRIATVAGPELEPNLSTVTTSLAAPLLEESEHAMTQPPVDGITFQVVAAGLPVPGACILVRLVMRLKNDASITLGPTDERGSMFASLEQLRARAEKQASYFPMDYRPDTWTRQVQARVMTHTDLERFEAAYESWWKEWPDLYVPGEVEALRGWAERIRVYSEEDLELTGEIFGSEIAELDIQPATWVEENRHRFWPNQT
jgi:hypothetical protein